MGSMGVKILLADDSPTVHKVIKIILKDEACEIIECAQEVELSGKLTQHRPAVVFLDFNFSETKTGYDLCRLIRQQSPSSKVLVMYGTFDAVDESALREAGAAQHVVKPFDTAKFIVQVRNLAEGLADTPRKTIKVEPDEPQEEWSIRETVERKTPDIGRMTHETVVDLGDELDQWGMMVPGVIGKSSGAPDLPPVIHQPEVKAPELPAHNFSLPVEAPVTTKVAADVVLPDQSDLEYPDMGGPSEISLDLDAPAPKSKLISLNELAPTEDNSTARLLELTGMDDVEGDQRLLEQIKDEVEEENLWAIDATEEAQPKLSMVKERESFQDEPRFSAHEDEFSPIDTSDTMFDDAFSDTPTTAGQPLANSALPGDLNELRPLLQQLVKEAVADYCRQHVDKVAWEVIPDLAENLIKNELKKISDKISRDL